MLGDLTRELQEVKAQQKALNDRIAHLEELVSHLTSSLSAEPSHSEPTSAVKEVKRKSRRKSSSILGDTLQTICTLKLIDEDNIFEEQCPVWLRGSVQRQFKGTFRHHFDDSLHHYEFSVRDLAASDPPVQVDPQERCERVISGMGNPVLTATVTKSPESRPLVKKCPDGVADDLSTAVPRGLVKCEAVKNEALENLCGDYSLPPGILD